MIITKKDILQMKADEVIKVKPESYSELNSLRTRLCEAKYWDEKPSDVERYSYALDRETGIVTIKAVKKQSL